MQPYRVSNYPTAVGVGALPHCLSRRIKVYHLRTVSDDSIGANTFESSSPPYRIQKRSLKNNTQDDRNDAGDAIQPASGQHPICSPNEPTTTRGLGAVLPMSVLYLLYFRRQCHRDTVASLNPKVTPKKNQKGKAKVSTIERRKKGQKGINGRRRTG